MSTLHAAASGAHNRSQAVAAQLLSGLAELDLITFVCFQIDFGVVGQTANQPRGAVFRFTLPAVDESSDISSSTCLQALPAPKGVACPKDQWL